MSARTESRCGIAKPEAIFYLGEGFVYSIAVRVRDVAQDDYPARAEYLRDVFAHVGGLVAAVAGTAWRREPGERGQLLWDLPSGAEMSVSRVTASVWLRVASPEYAALHRQG